MVEQISGQSKSISLGHVNIFNKIITLTEDIANTVAESFSNISDTVNDDKRFQKIKSKEEKINLTFDSDNAENYNQSLSIDDIIDAIHKLHDTVVGHVTHVSVTKTFAHF